MDQKLKHIFEAEIPAEFDLALETLGIKEEDVFAYGLDNGLIAGPVAFERMQASDRIYDEKPAYLEALHRSMIYGGMTQARRAMRILEKSHVNENNIGGFLKLLNETVSITDRLGGMIHDKYDFKSKGRNHSFNISYPEYVNGAS